MINVVTIFRREFAAYFRSPIGYIYVMVFIWINAALYMPSFFVVRHADMRWMFEYLPFLLCVLIPLITMRTWAEERRDNTIELLLTFPMSPYVVVIGKFFASFAIVFLTLLATLPIPIMLGILGEPDWGVIVTSYMGSLALAAFFLAIGIFISGLVRDQIVAAIVTLGICFVLCLAGYNYVVQLLDGWGEGWRLGTRLKDILGVLPHYLDFTRGLVRIFEIAYFVVWAALLLFANGFFLEARYRPWFRCYCALGLMLCLGIGLTFNFCIAGVNKGRWDCTQHKVHTLSDSSKSILQQLRAPVMLHFYVTPKEQMPSGCENLERDVVDILEDVKTASNNMVTYQIVYLDAPSIRKLEEATQAEVDHISFKVDDFIDMTSLLRKLRDDGNGISTYIHAEFPKFKELLDKYRDKTEPTEDVKDMLISTFNQLLQRKSLYNPQRFAHIKLSDHSRQLLEMQPQDTQLLRLNRLLLQEAYHGHIRDQEKMKRAKSAVQQLLEKGIKSFRVFAYQEDQQVTRVIYSSLGIIYKDKKETILQPINPWQLGELEYQLLSTIVRLSRPREPVAALFCPSSEISAEQREWLAQNNQNIPSNDYTELEQTLRKEGYKVAKTSLSKESPLPEDYDVLIVMEPRQLNARQKWEIARSLYRGKNVFMALQNYRFRYLQSQTGVIQGETEPINPGIDDLLCHYGLKLDEDILLDTDCFPVMRVDKFTQIVPGVGPVVKMGDPYAVKLPLHMIAPDINKDVSITARLSGVPYLWGSALQLDQRENLPLFNDTERPFGDFKNLSGLIGKLRKPPSPIYQYLRDRLTEQTRQLVDREQPLSEVKKAIICDLNSLVKSGQHFYHETLHDLKLTPETREFIAQNPKGEDLMCLNRMVIEETYPDEFYPRQANRNLEVTILMRSGEKAWKIPCMASWSEFDLNRNTRRDHYPLMVMLRGKFPDVYKDKTRPAWPKSMSKSISLTDQLMDAGAMVEDVVNRPATLIAIGCATTFMDPIRLQYEIGCTLRFLMEQDYNTKSLFVNSVEALTLGDELIHIRTHAVKTREIKLDQGKSKTMWRLIQFGLVPSILFLLGVGHAVWKRVRRQRYAQGL